MAEIEFDGIVNCKVLEIDPFKRLCYSWKNEPGSGKILLDSLVVWTLVAKDNGTELSLELSGFKEMENLTIFSMMNEGWAMNLRKIDERINLLKHDTTIS